jgi:hypothetical protein
VEIVADLLAGFTRFAYWPMIDLVSLMSCCGIRLGCLLICGVVEITYFFLYSSDTGHRLDENNTQLRQRCCSVTSDALSALPASSLPRTMITRFPLYYPLPTCTLQDLMIHSATPRFTPTDKSEGGRQRTEPLPALDTAYACFLICHVNIPIFGARLGTRGSLAWADMAALWHCRGLVR